jgi:hypothetical protein
MSEDTVTLEIQDGVLGSADSNENKETDNG